jgi:hypothetical protein
MPDFVKVIGNQSKNQTLNINNVNASSEPQNNSVVNSVSAPVVTTKGATLVKVLVSDIVDKKGSVSTSKDSFLVTTPKITVSAYILNAATDLKVTALMTYLPTNEQVGPVSNNEEIKGDIISNFSFTKPVENWPSGEYKITIRLSDGQTQSVNFTIK